MKKIILLCFLTSLVSATEIHDMQSDFTPYGNLLDQKLYEIYKRDKPVKKVRKCTNFNFNPGAVFGFVLDIAHGFGQAVGTIPSYETRRGSAGSPGPTCKTIEHRMNFKEFKESANISIGNLQLDQQFSKNQFKNIASVLMSSQKSSYMDELKIQFNKLISVYEEYYSCQALGEISLSEDKQTKNIQQELVDLLRNETTRLEELASKKRGISVVELRDSLRNYHIPYYDLDDESIDRLFKYNLMQDLSISVELQDACRANDEDVKETLIMTAVEKAINKSNIGNLRDAVNEHVFVHSNYHEVLKRIITRDCL